MQFMSFHHENVTHITEIYLLVKDINRSLDFYHDILGLDLITHQNSYIELGVGTRALVHLYEDSNAIEDLTLGLYHFALLLPNRSELAKMIYRLKEMKYPLTGAADHGVSEAIYLDDPDGNGIEIYVDKDVTLWPKDHDNITMYTKSIDLNGVLSSLDKYEFLGMHPDTVMGHLHLHVASLDQAKTFFIDILGFQKVLLYANSALFISDQGYHHHLGLNTWQTTSKLRQMRQVGLVAYRLHVPKDTYPDFSLRLTKHHVPLLKENGSMYIMDPLNQKVYIDIK
jgi:catechol 2,3-dioxygenase